MEHGGLWRRSGNTVPVRAAARVTTQDGARRLSDHDVCLVDVVL